MRQQFQVFELKVREKLGWGRINRIPEPSNEMIDLGSVQSFDKEGIDSGNLAPVYLLNALSIARRLPLHAKVLDLGSGSGRFMSVLARFRPDISIVGTELSDQMIELAHKNFESLNLFPRIRIEKVDMIKAISQFSESDAVISLFSLHHLPSLDHVKVLFKNISTLTKRKKSLVWIFDFHRPKREHSCNLFPQVFTPGGSKEFIDDTVNSMKASFTAEEIQSILDPHLVALLQHHISNPIRFYQTLTNLHEVPFADVKLPRLMPDEVYEIAKLFLICFNLPHLGHPPLTT